ncbi:MAG: hypothetical protein HUN04_16305 [Desulfobacter sp.]|nr:MAG: hypothetical protein HUN04_16305 [Desulfobacter sp.]
MKIKITLMAIILAGLMGIQAAGFAAEQKQEGAAEAVATAAGYTLEYGKTAVVRGVIEKTDAGLFLLDGKGTFLLKGEEDLSKLVGQPVEVKGLLKKGEKSNILLVEQVKVVE